MQFKPLPKLCKGDQVAILSPSFAAPGRWPDVYQLGLIRIRELFGLKPVEFPTTAKTGASREERSKDLIDAFKNPEIKAVIASIGGDDQVTYIKNLPTEPFINNPKPFFGFSDNTHFENFLWLNGIPSYYGGGLFNQFAMNGEMDEFTIRYLKLALFENKEVVLEHSPTYTDIGLNWDNSDLLKQKRVYEENGGWFWDGETNTSGITWGGCLESIDELLRHNIELPSLKDFESIILFTETSEEIPSADYVFRVFRALGERSILGRIKGILVGRAKAWEFDKQKNFKQKQEYKEEQRQTILKVVRQYNKTIPIIQNLDFGHTDPQICLPNGQKIKINALTKKISILF